MTDAANHDADYTALYGAARSARAISRDALDGCATHRDLHGALRSVVAILADVLDGPDPVRGVLP